MYSYAFEVDKHAGIFLVEDGSDSDDDFEFFFIGGCWSGFGWTSAFHLQVR